MIPDQAEMEDMVIPQNYVDSLAQAFPEETADTPDEPTEVKAEAEETPEVEATVDENTPEEIDVEKAQLVDLGFDDIKDVEVTVGEEAVTVNDLRQGYMRNADYTKKTQTLSADKRETEAIRSQYAQGLDFLNQQANQALEQFNGVNWDDMKMSDPASYQRTLKEYQDVQRAVDGVSKHREAFIQKANSDREAAAQKQAAESNEMLKNIIPDWGTEKYSKLREYAATSELNIGANEFESVTDWRFMRLLDKAMNFDAAQSITTEKVKKPLKTSITPKTSPQTGSKASKAKKSAALQALKETGSDAAMVEYYAQQIGDMGIT